MTYKEYKDLKPGDFVKLSSRGQHRLQMELLAPDNTICKTFGSTRIRIVKHTSLNENKHPVIYLAGDKEQYLGRRYLEKTLIKPIQILEEYFDELEKQYEKLENKFK